MRNRIREEDLEMIASADLPWHAFEGKSVLITGAGGFLPSYLVETLLHLNEHRFLSKSTVIGLVRNLDRARQRFAQYAERTDLQLIAQDVCTPFTTTDEVHFVIHAASQATPQYYGTDPVGTLTPNVIGTYNLLEFCKSQPLEGFLFLSSGEVYGEVSGSDIPTKEDRYGYLDPTNVRSCYAESKRMGETMCVAWHEQFEIPVRIVRTFHTYGPGIDLKDGRVFADFIANVVAGEDIILKSDGSAIRTFCYISDAITGFFTVLLKGENATAYNVGNTSAESSIRALADLLAGLHPEKKLKVVRNDSAIPVGYLKSPISRNCPDISKIRALGWEPFVSLKDGFARTIRSFFHAHE